MAKTFTASFEVNDDTSPAAFKQWLDTCPYAKGGNVTYGLPAGTAADPASDAPAPSAPAAPKKKAAAKSKAKAKKG